MQLVDNKAVDSLKVCRDHCADFFMHGTTVKGPAACDCSWNMTLNDGIAKLCLHARGEVQGCQGEGDGDTQAPYLNADADLDNLSNAGLPLLGCSRKMPAHIGTAGWTIWPGARRIQSYTQCGVIYVRGN